MGTGPGDDGTDWVEVGAGSADDGRGAHVTAGATTRGARAFVAVGVGWFVCWNAAALVGASRSATVALGLQGFVFAVIFGKAYALVPSYFDRELVAPSAPLVHLPLSIVGVLGLFLGRLRDGDPLASVVDASGLTADGLVAAGALAWLGGVLVFVATLAWTVRDNPTGAETGTAGPNRHRRPVDRAANAVVPVVGLYLLWGGLVPVLDALTDVRGSVSIPAIELGLGSTAATTLTLVPAGPAASHVLAAGAATLMLFGIGFRLLPRLLVGTPRPALVAITLATGAVAPALLVIDFQGGAIFTAGATLFAVAIVGYGLTVVELVHTSDRDRVGHRTIAIGGVLGIAAVGLGWAMGVELVDLAVADAHYRLAIGGFLGLTIVGVTFQFYPPAIGETVGVGERSATAVALALAGGFVVGAIGAWLTGAGIAQPGGGSGHLGPAIAHLGAAIVLLGSLGYAWILLTIFAERR